MSKLSLLIIGLLLMFHQSSDGLADDGGGFSDFRIEFKLENANGNLITEESLLGHYTLMGFGFTHCLHICPMMAANMAMALKISPTNAQGIFVSVDTERDSPEIVQAYASSYSESMTGLGGDYDQIRETANNFNISYVVTKSQKAYTVEHTSDIFLIGPDGKLLEVFALNASPQSMVDAMKASAD